MPTARIGHLLLTLGLIVGVLAGIGLLVGFEPARLPPALLNIAAYKLTFLTALGLFAAGATFLRYARREETRASATRVSEHPATALTEGQSAAPPGATRHPEAARAARSTEKGDG